MNLPDHAKYIAMDPSGRVYTYSTKPEFDDEAQEYIGTSTTFIGTIPQTILDPICVIPGLDLTPIIKTAFGETFEWTEDPEWI